MKRFGRLKEVATASPSSDTIGAELAVDGNASQL